jgi:uncharacterized glyoxalase superfamily protein PhnB
MHSQIIPMLTYEDGVAAMEWLCRVFGFEEKTKHHRQTCAQTAKWYSVSYVINAVLVFVDDVQVHFENSKKLGAGILSNLEFGEPGSRYRAEDLEGQRWMFMQKS